jgi:hypothetical protein
METLALILLFPLVCPLIAKAIFRTTITWGEMAFNIISVMAMITLMWLCGMWSQTHDFEIWNGEVLSKHREHDHYIESYRCNCHDVCSGTGQNRSCTEVCQTCYRDHYTVTWYAKTSIGSITLQHLDRTSKSVYAAPDPDSFKKCIVGEPVAQEHSFTNYVKAVPDSLFTQGAIAEHKVPNYPRVYDYYRIKRVINEGAVSAELANQINTGLSMELRKLGPKKQVNVVMILTKNQDPNYKYSVEKAWVGGKKNDVVIIAGIDANKITWVDLFTFAKNSGNELFHVLLRDGIREIGIVDSDRIVRVIASTVSEKFDRPKMRDFEYLKDSMAPPMWFCVLMFIIAAAGSVGISIFLHREEMF